MEEFKNTTGDIVLVTCEICKNEHYAYDVHITKDKKFICADCCENYRK